MYFVGSYALLLEVIALGNLSRADLLFEFKMLSPAWMSDLLAFEASICLTPPLTT